MTLISQKAVPTISPALRQKVADEARKFNNAPAHQIGTPDPARTRFKKFLNGLTEDNLCDVEVLFRLPPIDRHYDSFEEGWDELAGLNAPYPTKPERIEDIIAHSLLAARI